ncbi:MAG: PASTA domain-containing protein [Propionicimonas sp.]
MPSVSYKSVKEATEILKNAGFKVKVRHETKLLDVAAYTDPASGTMAPKGSTVTIVAV